VEVGDVDTLDVPEFDIDDVGEVVVDIDGVVERVLVGDFEMDEEKERVGVTLGDEEKLKSTSCTQFTSKPVDDCTINQ